MSAATIPGLEAGPAGSAPLMFDPGENPELCLYRDRTIALLRKYMRLALDAARMPSLLGKEIFRSKVTSYRMITFEDAVIFVRDLENCLEQLDEWSRTLILRCVVDEYTYDEIADMLGCARITIARNYPEALDRLSQILLWKGLLKTKTRRLRKSCQEAKNDETGVSESNDGKYKVGENETPG